MGAHPEGGTGTAKLRARTAIIPAYNEEGGYDGDKERGGPPKTVSVAQDIGEERQQSDQHTWNDTVQLHLGEAHDCFQESQQKVEAHLRVKRDFPGIVRVGIPEPAHFQGALRVADGTPLVHMKRVWVVPVGSYAGPESS
jgi:hypothetical protein